MLSIELHVWSFSTVNLSLLMGSLFVAIVVLYDYLYASQLLNMNWFAFICTMLWMKSTGHRSNKTAVITFPSCSVHKIEQINFLTIANKVAGY